MSRRAWFLPLLTIALGVTALAAPGFATVTQIPSGDRFKDRPLRASDRVEENGTATQAGAAAGPSFGRVAGSLAGVALLIVVLGWAWRRMVAAQERKGAEGVRLVSRSLLTPRHQVLIVRVGQRLLVVGDSGHGMNLLCEITDPAEAAILLGEADAELDREGESVDSYAAAPGADSGRALRYPDGDAEAVETPQTMDAARNDMRSLIERVRGLAGQMTQSRAESTGVSRLDS